MLPKEQSSEIMIMLFIFLIQVIGASKDIIVENPFYLRARIYDSHTANVQFEIAKEAVQRTCRMYKFTIRHNDDKAYPMAEQNLTFWRNSLELKELKAGNYRVCAIICSEHLQQPKFHYEKYMKKNRTTPIRACVNFHPFRPHLLILTLYILVFIFLIVSHIIHSLRKRQFKAHMKIILMEIENSLQKWRSNPIQHIQSSSVLQNVITLPASPIEQSVAIATQSNDNEQNSIIFHLEIPNE